MIVVDASVMVDLVLRDRLPVDVEETLASDDVDLHAPHLLDAEVVHALRRALHTGQASDDRLRLALRRLRSARIERWPIEPMVEHMWTWRHRLSAYDATYVVPAVTARFRLVGAQLTGREVVVVEPGVRTGMPILIDNPRPSSRRDGTRRTPKRRRADRNRRTRCPG